MNWEGFGKKLKALRKRQARTDAKNVQMKAQKKARQRANNRAPRSCW